MNDLSLVPAYVVRILLGRLVPERDVGYWAEISDDENKEIMYLALDKRPTAKLLAIEMLLEDFTRGHRACTTLWGSRWRR